MSFWKQCYDQARQWVKCYVIKWIQNNPSYNPIAFEFGFALVEIKLGKHTYHLPVQIDPEADLRFEYEGKVYKCPPTLVPAAELSEFVKYLS